MQLRLCLAVVFAMAAIHTTRGSEATPKPYLCIVSQATGFAFDNDSHEWKATLFSAGEKLLVKPIVNGGFDSSLGKTIPLEGAWAVWTFGDDTYPAAICAVGFGVEGYLNCNSGPAQYFQMNRKTGRFIRSSIVGFTSQPNLTLLGVVVPEVTNHP